MPHGSIFFSSSGQAADYRRRSSQLFRLASRARLAASVLARYLALLGLSTTTTASAVGSACAVGEAAIGATDRTAGEAGADLRRDPKSTEVRPALRSVGGWDFVPIADFDGRDLVPIARWVLPSLSQALLGDGGARWGVGAGECEASQESILGSESFGELLSFNVLRCASPMCFSCVRSGGRAHPLLFV